MTMFSRPYFAGTSAVAAIAAALALAGCNPQGNAGRDQAAYQLPALPATLPLAPGGTTRPAIAPSAALLPASRPIGMARVADPRDDYAYADDAWGFADALGDAPPDYGFYYDDVEPWAWQGYDNSIQFVEPLGSGYRYYYYRPGADAPYFVRDPDYGYGYDGGQLTVVYGPGGRIIPYTDYGPRLDYASRYYARGRALYSASRARRPVVAANWAARQNAIVDTQRWAAERAAQPAWQQYHQRTQPEQARHWDEEQARRRADTVRFAAWQGNDFRTPPPPRAIPQAWTQASWAQDNRRFAPPAAGFSGDAAARQQAAQRERDAIAARARQPQGRPQDLQLPPGARPGVTPQQQPPEPQVMTGRGEAQRLPFGPAASHQPGADMAARQQVERAQQAQRQQQEQIQRQQAAQQAAARQQQDRAAAAARQAQEQQQQRGAAQARERAQSQARAQQAAQQQARQREAQTQQRAQAEQRQAQQRAEQQAQAQQRQAAQAQQRVEAEQRHAQQRAEQQAQAQQRVQAQAQQRVQAQAQQRAQAQAQAQQRQAAQAQQRAEMQARQRPPAPPQPHPAPAARPQPSAPPANRPNPGEHKHERH